MKRKNCGVEGFVETHPRSTDYMNEQFQVCIGFLGLQSTGETIRTVLCLVLTLFCTCSCLFSLFDTCTLRTHALPTDPLYCQVQIACACTRMSCHWKYDGGHQPVYATTATRAPTNSRAWLILEKMFVAPTSLSINSNPRTHRFTPIDMYLLSSHAKLVSLCAHKNVDGGWCCWSWGQPVHTSTDSLSNNPLMPTQLQYTNSALTSIDHQWKRSED